MRLQGLVPFRIFSRSLQFVYPFWAVKGLYTQFERFRTLLTEFSWCFFIMGSLVLGACKLFATSFIGQFLRGFRISEGFGVSA